MKKCLLLFHLVIGILGASDEHTYRMCVLVSSRKLQYENAEVFFDSLLKQKGTPTVGHAWILLVEQEGDLEVQRIEGGHSGEFGRIAPQYFSQLVQNSQNPEIENPVQILYQPFYDGTFEKGDGGNVPTFAVSFDLTREGFLSLCSIMESKDDAYPFYKWSLTEHNCVQFVLTCLGRIGIVLDVKDVVQIPSVARINGMSIKMWTDERFSQIEVSTPEKLETELRKLISLGIAKEFFYKK